MQSDSGSDLSFFQRNANSLKGLVIFVLMLMLLIPASMIESIIRERQSRQYEAVSEVAGKWGLTQTINGPVLAVPYEIIMRNPAGQETNRDLKYAYLLPDDLQVNGEVFPEKRYRGIFEVVVYNSRLVLEGVFPKPQLENLLPAGAIVLWDKAVVQIGIPDLRGLKEQVSLNWDEQPAVVFEPGLTMSGVVASGIHVAVPLEAAGGAHRFHLEVALQGSGSLFFTPVGKVTEVNIRSTWSDPSFNGAFLPDQKNISPTGFDAQWKVLNLNRNYAQAWTSDTDVDFTGSTFGVDFLVPVDNYQKSIRSVKYAIMFIGLTFLVVFFVEMRNSRRVHPFQYALIGLALVIFYTLLVSISEHISFNGAYAVSAAMTIGLTGLYARALFDSRKMALLVGGTLLLLYGFLFTVLQLQDYALLIGSLGLFAILATVMYFSRKIDWQ